MLLLSRFLLAFFKHQRGMRHFIAVFDCSRTSSDGLRDYIRDIPLDIF